MFHIATAKGFQVAPVNCNTTWSVGQPLDTETIARILWSHTYESVSPKPRHDVKVNPQLDEGI